jgi:ABC-type nitrate/sulfonate/bicarbonate transport system ATPase subunit
MQQKDMLLPWKTVIDNVTLPKILKRVKKETAHKEALPYFKIFQLEGYEKKYPYEMSGGMRQRASLLRTFLTSGEIMLLDEPFGAVDSITRGMLQNWLLSVSRDLKLTILFITHDIEEAILLSDRVYVLDDKPSRVRDEITVAFHSENKAKRPVATEFIDYKKRILEDLRTFRGVIYENKKD